MMISHELIEILGMLRAPSSDGSTHACCPNDQKT